MDVTLPSPNSYLQININSTRLTHLLEDISKSLSAQNHRILNLSEDMKGSITILDSKIQSQKVLNKEQFDLLKAMIKNSKDQTNTLVNSIDRRLLEHKNQSDNRIQLLNQRITKTGNSCMEQSRELIDVLNQKSHHQQSELTNFAENLNSKVKIMEEKMKIFGQTANQQFSKLKDMLNAPADLKKSCSSLEYQKTDPDSFARNQSPRRKMFDEEKMVQIAAISAKLDQLENKINEKENAPMNKVLYSGGSSTFNPKKDKAKLMDLKKEKAKKNKNFDKIQESVEDDIGSLEIAIESIHEKIATIENIINGKVKYLIKDLDDSKYKYTILDQRLSILTRKVDKSSGLNLDLKEKVKQLEEKKVDQKLIDTLRSELSHCIKRTEDIVQTKCNKDVYQRDKNKNSQKFTILHENIVEKADKTEIKKALLFLEDKIKDIIVLIADEQNAEKDGAMTKIPLKCLSCDKGVENLKNFALNSTRSPTARSPENSMRCVSSKIRRKIRVANSSGCVTPC